MGVVIGVKVNSDIIMNNLRVNMNPTLRHIFHQLASAAITLHSLALFSAAYGY